MKAFEDIPLVDPERQVETDIYAVFRDLRERTSVVRLGPGLGALALRARHLDVVTGEGTRQIETETKQVEGIVGGPIFEFVAQAMLFSNGEAHLRRRRPVSRALALRLVEAMRPRAAAIAETLIEEAGVGGGPVDFLQDIAAQAPARMIADILGIGRLDLPLLMAWIDIASLALGPVDPRRRGSIERTLVEFDAYVGALLNERRTRPGDDLVGQYLAEGIGGGLLTESEARIQIVGTILAGADTTRSALCMCVARLLEHPQQWRALCADPHGLKKAAVEEGLRFEPVAAMIPRIAVRDLEIDGYLIPAGQMLGLSLVSALRDPDLYARPDEFDIHRADPPRRHLAFGAGPHRCAGEFLARVEIEEMLAALVRRAPDLRLLAPSPRLLPGVIRPVDQMVVSF